MEITFKNPSIYFIGGDARNGKTTLGLLLKEEYEKANKKVAVLEYSKYIKDYAKTYFGWNGSDETKPRKFLQDLGNDIIRKELNKSMFFINRIHEDIEILSYFFDVLIVDDARLRLEIESAKKDFDKATTIKVVRENFDNGLTLEENKHLTETDLDNYQQFDYIIKNNGTIEDLRNQALYIIKQEERIKNERND